jgi:hypothetical protein
LPTAGRPHTAQAAFHLARRTVQAIGCDGFQSRGVESSRSIRYTMAPNWARSDHSYSWGYSSSCMSRFEGSMPRGGRGTNVIHIFATKNNLWATGLAVPCLWPAGGPVDACVSRSLPSGLSPRSDPRTGLSRCPGRNKAKLERPSHRALRSVDNRHPQWSFCCRPCSVRPGDKTQVKNTVSLRLAL